MSGAGGTGNALPGDPWAMGGGMGSGGADVVDPLSRTADRTGGRSASGGGVGLVGIPGMPSVVSDQPAGPGPSGGGAGIGGGIVAHTGGAGWGGPCNGKESESAMLFVPLSDWRLRRHWAA